MRINGHTIDGVERDLTLLHRGMKERQDAIGWNSTGIQGRIMFIPYNKYQSPHQILPGPVTDLHICDRCEGVSTVP